MGRLADAHIISEATEGLIPQITTVAQAHGVDPDLMISLVDQESSGNPQAKSDEGAMGLCQLMPATAKELGVEDPWDPTQNLNGGSKYISQLLKMFDGDQSLALAAYNAGPGNVRKYGGIPPFAETQQYVQKIEARMKAMLIVC